jgi:hypothetical protein
MIGDPPWSLMSPETTIKKSGTHRFDQRSAAPQFKQPSSTSTVSLSTASLSTASLSTNTMKSDAMHDRSIIV